MKTIVNDYIFWSKLDFIKRVIEFIHQFQYIFEAEDHKFYTMTSNWNKIRAHLYSMVDEEKNANLYHITKIIWENRYLTQFIEFHVVAAFLISTNHNVKIIGLISEHFFFYYASVFWQIFISEKSTVNFETMICFSWSKRQFSSYFELLKISGKCRTFLKILSKIRIYIKHHCCKSGHVFWQFDDGWKKLISYESHHESNSQFFQGSQRW